MINLPLFATILLPLLCALPHKISAEVLEVPLATESDRQPMAICWYAESSEQQKQLEKVLLFDLEQSGSIQSLPIAYSMPPLPDNPWSLWSGSGAHYGLLLERVGNSIESTLYDLRTKRLCRSPRISLSTQLSQDRQQIHRLSDWVVEAISGRRGIAQTRLLYTVTTPNPSHGRTQLWQCDYDGANAHCILEESALLVSPCFIPGSRGSRYAVVSYKLGQPKILLGSIQGGRIRRATALGGSQLAPAFDRSGCQMAFVCDVEGNPDIYWMQIDLSCNSAQPPRKLFSTRQGTQASPCFSPDGKHLVLVSSKDGHPRLYLIEVQAQLQNRRVEEAKLISRKCRENTCPAWSPDGRYIAYSARNAGARQIWIYDTQTGRESCLTEGEEPKENPCWASDSFHLFFDTRDDEGWSISMINLQQRHPVRVSRQRGEARFPCCWP